MWNRISTYDILMKRISSWIKLFSLVRWACEQAPNMRIYEVSAFSLQSPAFLSYLRLRRACFHDEISTLRVLLESDILGWFCRRPQTKLLGRKQWETFFIAVAYYYSTKVNKSTNSISSKTKDPHFICFFFSFLRLRPLEFFWTYPKEEFSLFALYFNLGLFLF